jgi:hypothetical protein
MGVQKSANALLICTFCTPIIGGMKTCASNNPTWSLTDLSPLELKRKITTKEAAELNGVSEEMFKRHYRHLIRKIGPRRLAVELGDAINLPPPPRPP